MSNKKFTPFDWINEIKGAKRPWSSFTLEQQSAFNAYLTHRSLSFNTDMIELVNYAQGAFTPQATRELYAFYCEYVPKSNRFDKWVKSKTKQPSKELLEKIADYYGIGRRDAKDYVYLLDKKDMTTILTKMGVDNKELKKLLKW